MEIRHSIDRVMREKSIKQAELEKKLGITHQSISMAVYSNDKDKILKSLPKILNILELKLVLRPKQVWVLP